MKYKKNRRMTVSYAGGWRDDDVPMIRLQGHWLADLGFDIGDKIDVECWDGQLIITKADEIMVIR